MRKGTFALAAGLLVACGETHEGGVDGAVMDAASHVDGGDRDASSPCDDLSVVECFGASACAPRFDDACCPECSVGGCADCTRPEYLACVPLAESTCMSGTGCGSTPDWVCRPLAPSCADAHAVAATTCDRVGCVPAFPSGEGTPDPSTATCVPILPHVCTALCEREPPTCPTDTVPEANDSGCYTDRCIPAWVCE